MNETEATAAAYSQPREWLLWTAATAGGWLLGLLGNVISSIVLSATGLGAQLDADPSQITPEMSLIFMALSMGVLFFVGAAVGALQWLVLRRHIPGINRWAIFTGLGLVLGSVVMNVAYQFTFNEASLAFMGVGVGLMQWLLLRRELNKASWWLMISGLAWPLGYVLGNIIGAKAGAALGSTLLGGLLGVALTGAIIGALTGAVLLWLLRENRVLLDGLRAEAEQAKP